MREKRLRRAAKGQMSPQQRLSRQDERVMREAEAFRPQDQAKEGRSRPVIKAQGPRKADNNP